MQRIFGIVTVVQEGRFRLATDDGRVALFTLDHRAPIEPQDLPRLLGHARVEVIYTASAGRMAFTAHDVHTAGR